MIYLRRVFLGFCLIAPLTLLSVVLAHLDRLRYIIGLIVLSGLLLILCGLVGYLTEDIWSKNKPRSE